VVAYTALVDAAIRRQAARTWQGSAERAPFTMRIYLRPSPLVPRGFRVFGFPRPQLVAPDPGNEFAPSHSITSSARTRG